MRRLSVAASAACITLTLVACGGQQPGTDQSPVPEPATTAPAATPAPSPAATPAPTPTSPGGSTPGAPTGPTDPAKLDQAVLGADQLPGWQPAESADGPSEQQTIVEPAACQPLFDATLGKTASDMGAAIAFDRDDQRLTEVLDVVDNASASVTALEQALAACGSFTMADADEKTPAKVVRFDAGRIGDRAIGLKFTLQGEAPVDTYVIVAAHRDVTVTTIMEGEHPDPAALTDTTRKAMDKLVRTL